MFHNIPLSNDNTFNTKTNVQCKYNKKTGVFHNSPGLTVFYFC
jgi:hypothetical protein